MMPTRSALRFEQAADDGHAEARVIHVGIAGDDDDIALVPAQRGHLGARHRQEGRCRTLRWVFLAARFMRRYLWSSNSMCCRAAFRSHFGCFAKSLSGVFAESAFRFHGRV